MMHQDGWINGGWMWGAWAWIWLLVVILLVLGIVALVKYLRSRIGEDLEGYR